MREGPRGADGSDSPGPPPAVTPRPARHPLVRAAMWGALYFVAAQVGLHTTLPGQPLTLLSPSNGVLVLWFSLTTRRSLPWDVAVVSVVGMLTSHQLGLPVELVLASPVISAATAASFVLIMRRAAGGLSPYGAERTAWRMTDLGGLLLASVLAAAVVATLSTVTQLAAGLPTNDLTTLLVRWGRSASAMVTVAGLGLMLLGPVHAARRSGEARAQLERVLRAAGPRTGEALLLLVVTVGLYATVFGLLPHLPLTFLLFVATAWVGVRFPPVVAALHGFLAGSIAVACTLAGHGVFAAGIADPAQRAVIAQLFVGVIWTTGLALAVSRQQLAAAERLADSRLRLLEQVVHTVDDGMAVIDEHGRTLMINRAGRELFELAHEPGHGAHPTPAVATMHLLDGDGRRVTEDRAPFRRALAGETLQAEDFALRTHDGEVRYLRLSAVEVAPGADASRRVLVSYHDVTADRRRVDALTTFAGNVAHDLRGPLTVVEAWNEVLADTLQADGAISADQGLPITAKVATASWRMRDFIKVLLDYTLARDRPLDLEHVDLVAVGREVAELRTQAGPHVPTGSVEASLIRVLGSGTALADRVLMQIVLDNLVSNACKYVAPGVRPQIVITVESVEGTVRLSVLDNGIGIPEDQRERVFDSFHRVEHSGQIEGTGLGLGICHRIVERHGGRIRVDDATDGTCLRVSLPAATRPDPSTADGTVPSAPTGPRPGMGPDIGPGTPGTPSDLVDL